jgi:RHS repeat-associated protein
MYEEGITPGSTITQYTSYYSFGGKLVGMRRVVGNTSTQYRIVGDQLGSTSLIVDAQNTPAVVQQTYNKPYGEVAYSWSPSGGGPTSLTSIGYTGQRLEGGAGESGLMFYGARFYDPALAFFVSADNIAPGKGDPKTRNRYGYTLANPLKYTDPTGHCAHQEKGMSESQIARCDEVEARYNELGIDLEGDWSLAELMKVLDGIEKLLTEAHWSVEEFKFAMGIEGPGISNPRKLVLARVKEDRKNDAFESYDWQHNANRIEFYNGAFGTNNTGRVAVHELAHAMDSSSGDMWSAWLAGATGSGLGLSSEWPFVRYNAKEPVSEYGGTNWYEDFAESVAATVYPDDPRYNDPRYPKSSEGYQTRTDFVRTKVFQGVKDVYKKWNDHR